MGVGSWKLVRCDETAIVTATRETSADGPICVLRFVELATQSIWTFSIPAAGAEAFLMSVGDAWRPTDTVVGPAPMAAEPPGL